MLINAGWSVALYCQRCGKIEIHDISCFESIKEMKTLKCTCSYPQAKIVRTASSGQIRLQIPCSACGSMHESKFSKRKLLHLGMEKIYCSKDHFELGYIGRRKQIEDFLAYNKREFETIAGINQEERIEKQQIMLEILNQLHDMVKHGGVSCPCGHQVLDADIVGDSVIIECQNCGRYHSVPARDEADLQKVGVLRQIELTQGRFLARN